MANPLFQSSRSSNNPIINKFNSLKAKGPSEAVFNQMYNSNPNFRQFADSVRNKTPEEAFRQYGLDFNNFRDQRW